MKRESDSESLRALITAVVDATQHAHLGLIVTVDEGSEPYAIYANESALRILGATVDQVIGTSSFMHIAPEEHVKLREQRERRLAGELPPMPFEVTIVRRNDGVHVPVEVGTSRVTYKGKPAAVSFFQDITERRRAVERLEKSEAQFRLLIEAAPEAIAVLRGGVFLYVNPAFVRLLGYESREALLRHSMKELIHPDDLPRAAERTQHMYEARTQLPPIEYRIARHDGELAEVEVSSIPIEYAGAQAILSFARDVTQQNRSRAQLAQAERMAAVGTLAAGVAHEINNPLAYVQLNLAQALKELALATQDNPRLAPIAARLEETLAGVERVGTLTRDLRAFSRPTPDVVGPVDIQHVLTAALKMSAHEINVRARLVTRFEPTPRVVGNESRLIQVFLNLLLNAAQAIPEGNAGAHRVELVTRVEGDRVVVEVTDSGVGIEVEAQARIFDPFFSTKPVGLGTGLGLSICHSIVTSLGGELGVTSTPSRGSTFRVALPVATGTVTQVEPVIPDEPSARRARVLVIDDEQLLASALRASLSEDNDVEIASSGGEALSLLEGGATFDVILCDLMMDDVSGMDFYDELKRRLPGVEDRVVFMTGGAFTPRASAFLANLASPPLTKPFDIDEVSRVIAARARQ